MAWSERVRAARRTAADGAILLGAPAAVVGALYLWIYVSKRYAFPVGYDTPKYLWRSALAGAKGVSALAGAAPSPFRSNPDRAGFPALVNQLSAVLGVTVPHLVMVLPAAMAATIGLGAGAFARLSLRLPRWAIPVFVVAVGASANVSRMAGPGYNDNLILTAMAMSAATLAVLAASAPAATVGPSDGPRASSAGAIVLLTAGILTHWIFVALFAAILLAVAAMALPASLRSWRAGGRPFATPTGRLAAIVGGSAVLGGAALVTLVGSEPSPPRLPRTTFESKLVDDVPRYVFPVTGVLATVGAAFLWPWRRSRHVRPQGDRREGQPLGAWLTFAWALTGAAAALLLAVGVSLPVHRFLAFDLGIPLLVAAAVTGVAELLARRVAGGGRWLAAGLTVVILGGTSVIAFRAWNSTHPWIPPKQFAQASVAGRYLERVGGSGPVVFIVDLGGASPLASTSEAFHVIRTALAPRDIPRTLEYLGTPEDFLAGRPTLRQEPPTFDEASLQHWPSVRAVLDEDPIAVELAAFSRGYAAVVAAHPEWRVAPGVAVIQGPRPPGPYPPLQSNPTPLSGLALAVLWAAFLGVLVAVGAGWCAAFVRAPWVERLALSPAFGMATLALGGVLADRAGVRLHGASGAVVVMAVAVAGWALFALIARRDGHPAPPAPRGLDP